MSWYGVHPSRSKQEVRRLLPPRACRDCVYWFRVAIGTLPSDWHHSYEKCPRCGIPMWDLLEKFTEEVRSRRRGNPTIQ